MKKLFALVMVLVLCMTAASAMAKETTVKTFAEFLAAVEATDVDKITFGADILDGNGVKFTTKKTLVIDFAGHTYKFIDNAVGSSADTSTLGFQLLEGSKITMKNGTLTSNEGSGVKRLIQSYCDLELYNMELDGTHLDPHGDNSPNIVVSFNQGSNKISGDTSVTAGKDDKAFDVCHYDNYKGTSLTVDTTGEIKGDIELSGIDDDNPDNTKVKLDIANIDHSGELINKFKDDVQYDVWSKMANITGGLFTSGNIDDYVSPTKPVAAVGVGNDNDFYPDKDLVYGVGNPSVSRAINKSIEKNGAANTMITAVQGNVNVNNVPADVKVFSMGFIDGVTATINGVKVPTLSYEDLQNGNFKAYIVPSKAIANLPKTGDNSSLMLWVAVMAMAVVGFVASKKVRFN